MGRNEEYIPSLYQIKFTESEGNLTWYENQYNTTYNFSRSYNFAQSMWIWLPASKLMEGENLDMPNENFPLKRK